MKHQVRAWSWWCDYERGAERGACVIVSRAEVVKRGERTSAAGEARVRAARAGEARVRAARCESGLRLVKHMVQAVQRVVKHDVRLDVVGEARGRGRDKLSDCSKQVKVELVRGG